MKRTRQPAAVPAIKETARRRKLSKASAGLPLIEVPCDRNGEFEPQLIKKNQTRFDGFEEKVISLYARELTTRGIQGHLEEIYGVEV